MSTADIVALPSRAPRRLTSGRAETAALYEGTVRHRRFGPVGHAFSYRVFYAYLDVDALPGSFDRLPLWSARRAAPVRFRRRDYFDGGERPLGDAVRDLVEERSGRRPTGPVRLLTQPRTFGWLFNPLSVYFCFSSGDEELQTIVLEVTNTPRHERTWYVLDVGAERDGGWEFPKTMPVSPFLAPDLTYRLELDGPGERLHLRLDDRRGDDVVFAARLSLHRVALTSRTALTVPARHPLLTWRVSAAIYAQAVRLRHKGVPVHPHPNPTPIAVESEAA